MKIKKTHLAGCISLVLFLVTIFLYVYQPLGEGFYIIGDLLPITFSFLAVISGLYAYKLHGLKSIQGKALIFITLGIFFWFLGETTWGIYEIILGIGAPVASIADLFWLIGYPLFFLGFYYVWKLAASRITKRKLAFLIPIIILVCSFMLYLAIPTISDVNMSIVEKASTAGYVIGDMILLVVLLVAITYLSGTKFAKAWSIILLAVFLSTIADIYYMNFLEVYETGNMIDILWDLDYILFAFGFFYHRETVKEILFKAKGKKTVKDIK